MRRQLIARSDKIFNDIPNNSASNVGRRYDIFVYMGLISTVPVRRTHSRRMHERSSLLRNRSASNTLLADLAAR